MTLIRLDSTMSVHIQTIIDNKKHTVVFKLVSAREAKYQALCPLLC